MEMQEGNETFYCSFVSTHYIVCDCGETFPGEDALKEHLDKGHKVAKAKKNVVIVKKKPQKNVGSKIRVYSGSGPMQINGRPVFILNSKEEIKQEIEFDAEDGVLTVLEDHLENHHAEEIKQENICELPGVVKEEYVFAADVRDDEMPGQYETVVTSTNQLEKEHNYDKSVGEKEIFCEICGKSFGSDKAVRFHKYRMHQLTPEERTRRRGARKPAVCEVCGKNFASQAALRYHQRIHTGEKPYPCTECPKRFGMPLFLQIHLRTHTGERPYKCLQCPKAFGSQAALLRHDRVHTGEKPYGCPMCQKCFSQSNSMKLHVRTVHLKLPAPYKSRARRLRTGGRRAAGVAEDPAPVDFSLDSEHYDDTVSMLCETIDAPRAILR